MQIRMLCNEASHSKAVSVIQAGSMLDSDLAETRRMPSTKLRENWMLVHNLSMW